MTEQNQTPQAHDESLGLAGRMARAFIHSPLSPLLFFVMLVVGVLGLIFTPRQEDPQISVPMVDIFVQYPGASSEQVASLAIDPLQRIMSEIPGVKHVYSASQRGQGMVTVQFEVGESLGPSIVKVHDKLQSNLDHIPPGVSMPLVKPKGIDDVPVVTLTLWSEDLDDGALRTLSLDLLQRLKQIPNTGQGFIVGGRPEQVRVEVLPERLSGYGVSLDQVAETIRTANSEQRAGNLETGDSYYTVYTGSFLQTAEDIARLVVSVHDGVPVYVRDVAQVTQGPADAEQLVNFYTGVGYAGDVTADGMPAVTVAIAKKEGANGVTVANAIIDKVEDLKGHLLPDNVNVSVTRNYGETANDKVNELIFKLFIATAAVAVLVWLSLGLRPALVVLFVIPVVILVTVFSAWVLGYTIDRVSLFALIFSIGILVDDAIVVVENIYRRWLNKGEMDTATAVDAVREVGNPTILATFTVIAALLPMGFVSGMMGPYMEPIPALGSVAMLFSLFAAFIFTPWLAMRIRPSMAQLQKAEEREHHQNERLDRFFRGLLVPMIENRRRGWLTLAGIVAVFFLSCAMFYSKAVTVKMLPYDNKPEFSVVLDMPEGTALPVTANLTGRLAELVREIPEVTALQSYVGTAQPFDFNGMVRHYYLRNEPWQAELHIQLLDKKARDRSSHEIAVAARELLTPLVQKAGARLTIVEMPPGPPVLQSIVAEIYGPTGVRREVAQKMTDVFEQAEGIADVDNYMQQPYDIWRFEVDTEKSVRRGISVDAINRNLSMAMGGHRLGDVKQGTVLDPTYIVMQVPLEVRAQITRLSDLPIPAPDGSMVPLTELGRFVTVTQDPIVYHKDLRPVEYVVGDAVGRLAAPIYGMWEVEDLLDGYTTPDEVKLVGVDSTRYKRYLGPPANDAQSGFEWTGEWTVTYETFRDMGAAFAVALVLIYILVVWEFGNFLVPLVIMAPIPLTLIGIIPGHWLLDAEFTATSMIGFIALAGIIVRNSILLVDFSKHEVQNGRDVRDAVILSCKTRTRPILITALALVAGSSVILFDPIFQGMAISLLFGVLVSTLLTLVVIPLGCISARRNFCPAGGSPGCESGGDDDGGGPGPKKPLGPRLASGAMLMGAVVVGLARDLLRDMQAMLVAIASVPGVLARRRRAAQSAQAGQAQLELTATEAKAVQPETLDAVEPEPITEQEASATPQPDVLASETEDDSNKVEMVDAEIPVAQNEVPANSVHTTSESDVADFKEEGGASEVSSEVKSDEGAVVAAPASLPADEKPAVMATEESKAEKKKTVVKKKAASRKAAPKKATSKKAAAKKPASRKAAATKETTDKVTTAKEIELKEIEPKEIEAKEIEAKEIEAKEIEAKEIEAKEIEAKEIEAKEIEAKETTAQAETVKQPTVENSSASVQRAPSKKVNPKTGRRGIRLKPGIGQTTDESETH